MSYERTAEHRAAMRAVQLKRLEPRQAHTKTEKTCPSCKRLKPLAEFYRDRSTENGHYVYCKVCMKRRAQASNLKQYGMTAEMYEQALNRQGGLCAICRRAGNKSGRRLGVDHNHATGVVRGLLCDSCNRGIGYMRDDASVVLRAAEYLLLHGRAGHASNSVAEQVRLEPDDVVGAM